MLLQTQFLLTKYLQFTPLIGLTFCATLFLYALHRIVGLAKVQPFTEKGRYQVISKFKSHIIGYAVLAAIGGLYFFWQVAWAIKLALIIPAILSLGYVLPILAGKKRLRDFNFIKIFLIAIVWAWVAVFLPFLENETTLGYSFFLLFLEKALFIFAITLPFDIRDLKVDAHTAGQTIPAKIGARKTKYLAAFCIGISVLLAFLNVYLHFYDLLTGFALLFAGLITVVIISYSDKTEEDYFFTGLVDGTMLIQFGLVYGFSFL